MEDCASESPAASLKPSKMAAEGGEGGEARRAKEQVVTASRALALVVQELAVQQARIEEIVAHLTRQNELLADFQRDTLLKLGQNSKAALREQLATINKDTLNDLRDIKNANENVANALIGQDRRLARMEAALELIHRHLAPQ